MDWRRRLGALLHGPEPTLEQATRAVIAFGGMQDRAIQFAGTPPDELRGATVEGACAALGIEPTGAVGAAAEAGCEADD